MRFNISTGRISSPDFRLRAEVQNGVAGGKMPDSLPELVKSIVYTQDAIHYPATPAPLAKTLKLASIPLEESKRHFVAFPGSAFYSPLPYLPAGIGYIPSGGCLGLHLCIWSILDVCSIV